MFVSLVALGSAGETGPKTRLGATRGLRMRKFGQGDNTRRDNFIPSRSAAKECRARLEGSKLQAANRDKSASKSGPDCGWDGWTQGLDRGVRPWGLWQ